MLTQADLEMEVFTVIERALAQGNVAPAAWITQSVIADHTAISGDDADWYRLCAYGHVRDAVRKCLRRYRLDPETAADPQLTLEGFERVQKMYLVERAGDQVIVPTEQLTPTEVGDKIAELRQMGTGCFLYADELERYLNQRQSTVTAD